VASIRRILCPIDFSNCSRRALDYAVSVAKSYGSVIDVVYVHPLGPSGSRGVAGTAGPEPLTSRDRAAILQALADWVADGRAGDVPIDTWVEEGNNVAQVILARAAVFDADLILLGTHGEAGFERLMLGSTADKVLRRASCSVLTVPPSGRTGPQSLREVQRIVCGVEFSATSMRAWRQALSLARQSGARLTAIHVIELPPDVPEPPLAAFQESRTVRFQRARSAMKATLTPRARALCAIDELLLVGKPYREILRVASDQQADLIILGAHAQGAADSRFLGSTTDHVARACECPLLVVRPSRAPDDVGGETTSAISGVTTMHH
jgi:nucleotide-binding universal stress UspA family protein